MEKPAGRITFLGICVLLAVFFIQPVMASAQTLIWRGSISSKGERTASIRLTRGKTYFIVVSGSFYMGRWWKNKRSIMNDPCYEFNAHYQPALIPVLKNNLGIGYCSQYNPNHVYRSANFVSNGQPLYFWIADSDYRDNRGSLTAEVYIVSP